MNLTFTLAYCYTQVSLALLVGIVNTNDKYSSCFCSVEKFLKPWLDNTQLLRLNTSACINRQVLTLSVQTEMYHHNQVCCVSRSCVSL